MLIPTFRILGSVTVGRERKQFGYLCAALFLFLLAAKLCHIHILWAEEGYASAAAVQILHGKMLYRDFWFDKPPLAALLYAVERLRSVVRAGDLEGFRALMTRGKTYLTAREPR